MLTRAEELAKKEHRTMSELVREALRQYERKSWRDEMNAYGRQSAEAVGVRTEGDVVNPIRVGALWRVLVVLTMITESRSLRPRIRCCNGGRE